ncbi:hypothetical protein [Halobaculum lipolyticum]|uniref:PH domain-containing protein n=1 Tax=Halobaculum lipolyticum TaxID=3032001 RepID=A0ABD5WDK9_9EURY|nr:hypothetical protein [Halobaculum sp. DT31]
MTALHPIRRAALPASLALFAALVVAPATTLLPGIPADPALVSGVAVGVAAVVLGGAVAADDLAGAVSDGRLRRVVEVGLFPSAAWTVAALAVIDAGTPLAWVALAGAAACVPGATALWVADANTTRRRLDDATVRVRFDGDGPSATLGVGAVVASVFPAVATATVLFDLPVDESLLSLTTTLAGLATVGSTVFSALRDDDGDDDEDDDDPTAAVTDAGIRIGDRLHGWETLEGYRLTDEAVEVRRDTWLRPTMSFDRDDLADEAAVVEAIGRSLPRVGAEGRVEMAASPGHGRSLREGESVGRRRPRDRGTESVRERERE